MRPRWLAVCALLAGTAPGRPAAAYVRTTTSAGAPMFWNRTVLEITAYVGDPLPGLEDGELLRATRAAAATWSRGEVPCPSMEMRISSIELADAPVGLDGQSRLTFRRQQWCRVPRA